MRIAVLSLHTSPAAQPGQGDAGGLNVYVRATATQLVRMGHEVEIFTADPAEEATGTSTLEPGIRLHRLPSPARDKLGMSTAADDLAAALADHPAMTGCALIWAHYWVSAEVALLVRDALAGTGGYGTQPDGTQPGAGAPGRRAPRVFVSFHTIAAVKDRDSGSADAPPERLAAEARIAARADLLIANTASEADDMHTLLGADPGRIVVAVPGVDRDIFTPGPMQDARRAVGLTDADLLVLYVGRMQRIKGTDTAVAAIGALERVAPVLAARTRLVMLGAASGASSEAADAATMIADHRAARRITVLPPVPARELADWYRSADVLIMPSRSESFGFAAAEAAACGVPVIASAVGGLGHVVRHGETGLLVGDADPMTWAEALEGLLLDPSIRARMGARAHERAAEFDWRASVHAVMTAAVGESEEVRG